MSVTFDFTGKRVLVTGGARGVGEAIVTKFLSSGATVFALDREESNLKKLKEKHPSVETICVDLLDWTATKHAVESVAPIHHLVNNAGIPLADYFMEIPESNIDRIFGVNFKAMVNVSQCMARGLTVDSTGGGTGTIVNISSTIDSKVVPGTGMYSCTKAAVSMLTKVMAVELAPLSIRVNTVRPNYMQTELATQGATNQETSAAVKAFCTGRQVTSRMCTVEDTADAVIYLSSDASKMVNGSDILVDGGMYTT